MVFKKKTVQLYSASFFGLPSPHSTIVSFDLEWDAVRHFLEHKRRDFPWSSGTGEGCGPVALGVAGSGSKANEVPELIPIITAHTINYKYK